MNAASEFSAARVETNDGISRAGARDERRAIALETGVEGQRGNPTGPLVSTCGGASPYVGEPSPVDEATRLVELERRLEVLGRRAAEDVARITADFAGLRREVEALRRSRGAA